MRRCGTCKDWKQPTCAVGKATEAYEIACLAHNEYDSGTPEPIYLEPEPKFSIPELDPIYKNRLREAQVGWFDCANERSALRTQLGIQSEELLACSKELRKLKIDLEAAHNLISSLQRKFNWLQKHTSEGVTELQEYLKGDA